MLKSLIPIRTTTAGKLISVMLLIPFLACGQKTMIDNVNPRTDINGNIVDAHDGRVIQFEDKFYWYGTHYENTNGFTTANHYVVYSSDDLNNWKYEGKLLPDQPEGVYYRPHVIYNAQTEKYILWYNWYPKLWNGQFGVAVSDKPAGPFIIRNDNVQMAHSDVGLGDFGLFVDDDQQAYISYNTIQGHQVSVEMLNEDYTASTLKNSGFITKYSEAGSMFKRNGKYYLLTDYTCCFCNQGSGARVYISDNPMADWTLTGNINRYPGEQTYILNNDNVRGTEYETIRNTGQGWQNVTVIFNEATAINGLDLHLYTGNRPSACGEVDNPRVHPEYEAPKFKILYDSADNLKEITTSATLSKSALKEMLSFSFDNVKISKLIIQPTEHKFDEIYINEIDINGLGDNGAEYFIAGPEIKKMPIIPAQQTYVMTLETSGGKEYIWMGDMWGSASDGVKGHDYQYWSAPLEFNANGTIKTMEWTDTWTVKVK